MFLGYGRGMMGRFSQVMGFGLGRGRGFGLGFARGFSRQPFYGWGRGGFPRCNTPGLRRSMVMGIPYRLTRRSGWFYQTNNFISKSA